jgi:glycerol-3-phosphate dehydrogenase
MLPTQLLARYTRGYGTRINALLAGRSCLEDMGNEIACRLYEVEVDYLMQFEWAYEASNILWRRSELGLHLPVDAEEKLDGWIKVRRENRQQP